MLKKPPYNKKMSIHILEMPLDFGGNRHGSDMGPSAIRLAGLKDRLQKLGLETKKYFSPIELTPQEYEDEGEENARFLKPIVMACNQLALQVETALKQGAFPLVLGGDHSISLGTLAGLSSYCREKDCSLVSSTSMPTEILTPPKPHPRETFTACVWRHRADMAFQN